MAENQEKTEAEILEETMQNLNLEEETEETENKSETEENDLDNNLEESFDDEKLIDDSDKELSSELNDNNDEITAVDDINLNNEQSNEDKIDSVSIDDLESNEDGVQKKQSKLHKILIIIVSILFGIIIVGAILYFIGFFDPKPIEKVNTEDIKKEQVKDEYKFNPKDIDENRLNKKLNLLTKY